MAGKWVTRGRRARQAALGGAPESGVDPAPVLAQAVMRAAALLDLTQKQLAAILGVSEASVSRLERGRGIEPTTKEGELAALFLRMWRSLDALVGGEDEKARAWFHAENDHLRGAPAERVQNVTGLVDVADYLDAMRGKL
jgi:transcriptional regulator with XRE-family HTH domain